MVYCQQESACNKGKTRHKIAHGRTNEINFNEGKLSRFKSIMTICELLRLIALDIMLLSLHNQEELEDIEEKINHD